MKIAQLGAAVILSCFGAACIPDTPLSTTKVTGKAADAGTKMVVDAGIKVDAGVVDAGVVDAGVIDAGCIAPLFGTPDAGTVEALIITNNALAASLQLLADVHTGTGVTTKVVTVESICSTTTCNDADPKQDTAKAIKNAIMARTGLRYVLLGGGLEVVPARRVKDAYKNALWPGADFQAEFVTDYYYSDFSNWDTDEDGIYAEKGDDRPNYRPVVSVSRLPVHNEAEVLAYSYKVIRHMTEYDGAKANKALLISNIAAEVFGLDVDSAQYFEAPDRTIAQLSPGFTVKKLYASQLTDVWAEKYKRSAVAPAFQEGHNIIVHSGHASANLLMTEADGSQAFTGTDAYALNNSTLPIFLSCGCEAGDFSLTSPAGEKLLQAPKGGAIAYLGNAPVGLGIAGGMQLIDELLRSIRDNTSNTPRLGDAYLAAHLNLPHQDTFAPPLLKWEIPVVDEDSYRWTQKSVVLFGDHMIPVWKTALPFGPQVTAKKALICGGANVTFTFSAPTTGTLRVIAEGELYTIELANQTSVSLNINKDVAKVRVGLTSPTTQFKLLELPL